jgi:integrase/recombinase XerD
MSTCTISPLRQRMIDDMTARHLGPWTQKAYIRSCKRFTAFLERSPDTTTADDIRRFQLDLAQSPLSIHNRNGIVTGVKFLFRVTLRRHDLAAEFYQVREPRKIPPVMSPDEIARLLAAAQTLKLRVMLALAYGCGLRAGEVVRLKVGDIDSAQNIIRIVQSKGRKDRNVMLPPEGLAILRQWWPKRPTKYDAGVPKEERSRSHLLGNCLRKSRKTFQTRSPRRMSPSTSTVSGGYWRSATGRSPVFRPLMQRLR